MELNAFSLVVEQISTGYQSKGLANDIKLPFVTIHQLL